MAPKKNTDDAGELEVVEPIDELDVEELLVGPSPWDAQWPDEATVRYSKGGAIDELELQHVTEDGVVLRRTVKRGDTIKVSRELADELVDRADGDFTKEA